MKRKTKAWRIIALQEDQYGSPEALQAMLTLGSGTAGRGPTLILWWAKAGTGWFVESSGNSRTN